MKEHLNRLKIDFINRNTLTVYLVTFLGGLVAHGYIMFAKYPNYDEFASMFHYGQGYALGRWFLALLGNLIFRIDGLYSLPWFNGIVSLVLLSLALVLFLKPFGIKSTIMSCLIGLIYIAFPSVTATMSYMFTAPFYALSVFLCALVFYICIKYRYGFIVGVGFMCLSLGIYQAYFCLAAVFALLYCLYMLLGDREEFKVTLNKAVRLVVMLAGGMILYFIMNKVMTLVKHVELNDYQGVSEMGKYSVSSIFAAIAQAYRQYFLVLFDDYNTLFSYRILNIAVVICQFMAFLMLVCLIVRLFKKKDMPKAVSGTVLVLLLPLATDLIFVMCANSTHTIHALMCHAMFLMYALPLFFAESFADGSERVGRLLVSCAGIGIVVTVVIYAKFANMTYFAYDLHFKQAYSEFQLLETKIKTARDYNTEYPVMFVGNYHGAQPMWELRYAERLAGTYQTSHIMSSGEMRASFFRIFMGYSYNEAFMTDEIKNSEEYRQMPVYPNDGSVRVIDDTVVVKFSEE